MIYLIKFYTEYDKPVLVKMHYYTDDTLAATARAKWCKKPLHNASVTKVYRGEV